MTSNLNNFMLVFYKSNLRVVMSIYRAGRAFFASSFPQAENEPSTWGLLLIAIVIIVMDGLLAAGAWFAVGYIIGK